MSGALKKTWLWWSSGKDSAWTLRVLRRDPAFHVDALVTTINTHADRVAMHAVRTDLVQAQAEALGLPLHLGKIPYPCPNGAYEASAREIVENAEQQGVTHMAFGDLFLEDIRAYREDLLKDSSIEPIFPLWGLDTKELAAQMVDAGVCAHLTCVDPKVLPPSFVGRRFNADLLADLPAAVDPCGERGEFHTFVSSTAEFSRPLQVFVGEVVERDGFVFADLLKGSSPEKRQV